MMIIPISVRIRIKSGPRSWDVQEYCEWVDKNGEEKSTWQGRTYHNTLSQALRAIFQKETREIGGALGEDTKSIVKALEELRVKYDNIILGIDGEWVDKEVERMAKRRREK